jgi:diadenosine tetraphosphate (Ap4A) HIT family hydrolase
MDKNGRSCIFCDIIQKKKEHYLIAEDESFFVILDIFPLRPGHVLILAKRHVEVIEELHEIERGILINWVNKISQGLKHSSLGVRSTQILLNNGKEANQSIPHLHFHIIPRYERDLCSLFFNLLTRYFNPLMKMGRKADLEKIKEKIKASL